MSSNRLSRLEFLKTGALTTAAWGSGAFFQRQNGILKKSKTGDAKNVIFLVSDGMSSGTFTLADLVKQAQFGEKTNWIKLYESDRKYYRGLMDMASLNSTVTGSAAAASSWGSGHRINNEAVNWGPDDEQYKTICEIFRDAGKGTGLVTTTRLTHATPAGFAINMPSRWMEDEIAMQYSGRNYDLLLGGGRRHFLPARREDGKDLYQVFRQNGYTIVESKEELKRATRNSKLLGLFNDSHLPYMVDYNSTPEIRRVTPTLKEMTEAALQRLDKNPNGFLLQIEGGRVDHGAHDNDAAGIIYDQLAFDDAIKIVMDFTGNRDDTLVILTTDHGNANPALNAEGPRYGDSPAHMATLFEYRHSFEWIRRELREIRNDKSWRTLPVSKIRDVIEHATHTKIRSDEALMIREAFEGKFRAPYHDRQGAVAVMAGVLANYNSIYFTGTGHTADYVELAAWGPGSERIPEFVRNTRLFDLMVEMAGVREFAEG